uniref:Uncharacterized protein n=1 Tax=Coccolithus braarudii TaxID=221442 RepID=A0A7S0LTH5_9EUKA
MQGSAGAAATMGKEICNCTSHMATATASVAGKAVHATAHGSSHVANTTVSAAGRAMHATASAFGMADPEVRPQADAGYLSVDSEDGLAEEDPRKALAERGEKLSGLQSNLDRMLSDSAGFYSVARDLRIKEEARARRASLRRPHV